VTAAHQLALLTECLLPGCRHPAAPGHPCEDCLTLFDGSDAVGGWAIRQANAEAQAAPAAPRPATPVVHNAVHPPVDEPERKANQRCWLCEERRTCVRTPAGWECADCQEVT
jgi:hypothetical protein